MLGSGHYGGRGFPHVVGPLYRLTRAQGMPTRAWPTRSRPKRARPTTAQGADKGPAHNGLGWSPRAQGGPQVPKRAHKDPGGPQGPKGGSL